MSLAARVSGAVVACTCMHALSAAPAAAEERCLDYADGKRIGALDDKRMQEVSGLAASELQPGILWAHNDSGASTWLYAIDEGGELVARFEVDGADAVDWEDVALGPCGAPDGLRDCLFVADTGNNVGDREDQAIYRVVEPDVGDASELTEPADVMGIVLPEGVDVEALFLDAQGALWLVSKRDTKALLFTVGRFEADATIEAELVAERKDIEFVTGADATADGTRIVLRSARRAWEIFRPKGRAMRSAFLGEALEIELDKEPQGEAVALEPDGSGFYTTSEGRGAPIRWYRCKRFGATLTGKEDAGGLVADPPEVDAGAGCAGGGAGGAAALGVALALALARGRRRRKTGMSSRRSPAISSLGP
ncbi:MAG: hypothetical protein IT385_23715 [Deltaproteobacteria bacterium]|nr:hypothetical protein [Deltaproteobacteria bacterium]